MPIHMRTEEKEENDAEGDDLVVLDATAAVLDAVDAERPDGDKNKNHRHHVDGEEESSSSSFSLLPSLTEVLECQISSWYPTFFENVTAKKGDGAVTSAATEEGGEQLDAYEPTSPSSPPPPPPSVSSPIKRKVRKRVTIRTVLLDVSVEFVDTYLKSNGTVRLPPGSTTSSILRTGRPAERNDDSDSDDDNWSSSSSTDEPTKDGDDEVPLPWFAELDDQIRRAVQQLGGSVFPKLNWSAPKDATWMNAGSLRCQTPGDIYLLLQASDFVNHDVHHAMTDVRNDDDDGGEGVATAPSATFSGFTLALRKWCNLYPSQEFRCFVKDRQMVAISQRHSSLHFPHLVRQQSVIRTALVEFHDVYVADTFAISAAGQPIVKNYVLDVYLDQQNKVWIVDFNVWGNRTDSLLFTWQELECMVNTSNAAGTPSGDDEDEEATEELRPTAAAAAAVVMRVVETSKQVRHDPLASYRAPIDAVHVAGLGGGTGGVGGNSRAFDEFAKLCRRPDHVGDIGADDDDDDDSSYEDDDT